MLRPEYLFFWILFHLAAVELPSFLQKKSTPSAEVHRLVKSNRYIEAVATYDSSKLSSNYRESVAYIRALSELRENQKAYNELSRLKARFPKKNDVELKLCEIRLLQRLGKYKTAIGLITANTGVLNQRYLFPFSGDTITTENNEEIVVSNYSIDTTPFYGVIHSEKDSVWYYNLRKSVPSGVLSNVDPKFSDHYTKILKVKGDLFSGEAELLSGQPVNRDVEISSLDRFGNQIFSTQNKIVNDSDVFCLNIKRRFFNQSYGKITDEYVLTKDLQFNYSSMTFDQTFDRVLYVTDYYGGFGDGDVYMADVVYNEDSTKFQIKNPFNLGEQVNTGWGESDPLFLTDDIVAYCTEGRIGFGDRDIYFYSIRNNVSVNAGPAINTAGMEYGLTKNGNRLYWSSKLPGEFSTSTLRSGSLSIEDIYARMQLVISRRQSPSNTMTEDFYYPVEEAVTGIDLDRSSNIIDTIVITQVVRDTFIPEVEVSYFDTFKNQNLVADATFLYSDDSLRLELAQNVDPSSNLTDYHFFDVYFPEKSIRFEPQCDIELKLAAILLMKRRDWGVEIRSHTDYTGSERYNRELSLTRSYSVKKYLIGLGVDESQIKTFGFGEAFPKNHCREGVKCTEREMRENRRTELLLFPLN